MEGLFETRHDSLKKSIFYPVDEDVPSAGAGIVQRTFHVGFRGQQYHGQNDAALFQARMRRKDQSATLSRERQAECLYLSIAILKGSLASTLEIPPRDF
jgi:hypothetical protein